MSKSGSIHKEANMTNDERQAIAHKVLVISGAAAKKARMESGMTLRGMSIYSGFSESALSRFEAGQRNNLYFMTLYFSLMSHAAMKEWQHKVEEALDYGIRK